ncbi:hypothetical protein AQF98_06665 [Pedobacter sp. Hv1]|nr:hypothetical protein AQF98_06665 [Pedobacter sp. Hv1]
MVIIVLLKIISLLVYFLHRKVEDYFSQCQDFLKFIFKKLKNLILNVLDPVFSRKLEVLS